MNCLLPAFFVLSAQALKLVPQRNDQHAIAMEAKENRKLMAASALIEAKSEEAFDELESEKLAAAVNLARKAVVEGLIPTDFNERQAHRDLRIHGPLLKGIFGTCMLAAAGIIALLYWQRGWVTVVSVAGYLASLCTMSNMIRNIFVTHNFEYPQFVTAFHALCSCLVGFAILQHRQQSTGQKITFPTPQTITTGLGPVAFCFALNLGCANLALLHSNTHFYEMFSATNILCTFSLGFLLGRPANVKLLPSLTLVTVGVVTVAFGEVKFSWIGASFVFASVLFRGFKAQLQSMLMAPGVMMQTFDPVELVCWTSLMTFFIMMIWSMMSEGAAPWQKFDNLGVFGAVGVSCINAVILNNAGLFVMKEVGPLGQQIIGEMKGILACLGAVAVFGEIITLQQILGYGIVVIGAQWYNRSHMQVQQEEKEAKEGLEAKKLQSEKA